MCFQGLGASALELSSVSVCSNDSVSEVPPMSPDPSGSRPALSGCPGEGRCHKACDEFLSTGLASRSRVLPFS